MSTSFRITQSRVGAPRSGFIGALVGGNDPGDSIDIVAETDETANHREAADFVSDSVGSVVNAFRRLTQDDDLIAAEVVDEDGGAYEYPEHSGAILFSSDFLGGYRVVGDITHAGVQNYLSDHPNAGETPDDFDRSTQ